jgi:hypothetical protein
MHARADPADERKGEHCECIQYRRLGRVSQERRVYGSEARGDWTDEDGGERGGRPVYSSELYCAVSISLRNFLYMQAKV